jgi:hypothetical protein
MPGLVLLADYSLDVRTKAVETRAELLRSLDEALMESFYDCAECSSNYNPFMNSSRRSVLAGLSLIPALSGKPVSRPWKPRVEHTRKFSSSKSILCRRARLQ